MTKSNGRITSGQRPRPLPQSSARRPYAAEARRPPLTGQRVMTDAYIIDHVRTPRGRGKPDGALHGITPIQLLTQLLDTLRERNELDTSLVEDVIIGCVTPVGEQGADIARV